MGGQTNRRIRLLAPDALDGRTVWITGGGSGLGRAMALRFAELGANVALSGRRPAPLERTADDVRARGRLAAVAPCDVRDAEAVERAFVQATDAIGSLPDTLVNNAAGNFLCPSEKLSPNAFAAVVGIVLHGTFHATSVAARRWLDDECDGTVLNVATTYADTGSAYVLPSACGKAGVVAMTRSLAAEWGGRGIRINAIAPGPIPTEGAFTRLMPREDIVEARARALPAGRFGTPEELAELAAFVVSDAAAWMHGEVITFDGGERVRNAGEFNFLLDEDVDWEALRSRS